MWWLSVKEANKDRTQDRVPVPSSQRLVDIIKDWVMRYVKQTTTRVGYATWVAADSGDADLSTIQFADGRTMNYIPKLASATGLSSGDPVLILVGGNQTVIILGKPTGDVSIAVEDI